MRALYRFYLYTVFILLSVYATYACVQLLSTLFLLTPLRTSYEAQPSSNDVVQAITLALVSFVVILLIGGLHYWLIRRDIAQDAEAATSPIRSFFLYITEGIAAALSLPTLGYVFLSLASSNSVSGLLAFALPTLALALLLELERRRIPSLTTGATAVFLRIHTYGVQAILLIVLGISWSQALLPLIDGLLFGGRAHAESCVGVDPCPSNNLFLLALAGFWFIGTWLFYGWLTSRDTSRSLRFVLHGLGFAAGISIFVSGLYNVFTVILLFIFHEPAALSSILGMGARYDFVGQLTLGLLITALYHVWMRTGVRQGLLPTQTNLRLIELAIISVLTAITFWWGMGNLLYNTFALLLKFPQPIELQSWVSAGAFILAGCVSIVIEFYLHSKNRSEPAIAAGPRRAQVLALLAIGTLTFSVAIATTLYIGLTTILQSPIANWMQVLSFGLAALLVGLSLTGFYLYIALNERQFNRTTKPAPTPTNTSVQPTTPTTIEDSPNRATTPEATTNAEDQSELATIETILDQLLANQITRAEASTKLHDLMHIANTH
jgi:hypothetical protein